VARDEFGAGVKDTLGKRVAYRCANPQCRVVTIGPHSQNTKTVNTGVAAHIGAASPGGPRFDVSQSSEDRAAIDNAVWLCQRCAKLVDSDVESFSASRLRRWKVDAEAETLRALTGGAEDDVYPQPPTARHLPIPRVAGQLFAVARERLLRAGWQPVLNPSPHVPNATISGGNGRLMLQRGYSELTDASPVGLAYCKFRYRDAYGNELRIVTAGEAEGDTGDVLVWSWEVSPHEDSTSTDAEYSRLVAEVREGIGRARERTATAASAHRIHANVEGGLGGSRDRLFRTEVSDRTARLDAAETELQAVETVSGLASVAQLARLETLLRQVTSISEKSREDVEAISANRGRL
jgi:hypothetical protein